VPPLRPRRTDFAKNPYLPYKEHRSMMMNRRNFSAAESIDLVAGTSAWPLTTSSRNLSPVASPQGSPATEIFCEPWRLLRSAVQIC
jgi:hypothetical protein